MKRLVLQLLSFALILGPTGLSGRPIAGKWSGVLVDKKCFVHCAKKSDMSMLDGHERSCVMTCAPNGKGVGLVVGTMYYGFDRTGEKLAWKLLQHSKSEQTIRVLVTGTLQDSIINVGTLKPTSVKAGAAE